MSLLAATQIPKPADEQAFERASVVLWRNLLGDPNVQRNGRRGQRQNGVDLYGVRNGDPAHHIGIQCKLKGDGQVLTEDEVRDEVRKALTFRPELKEYFIITTAPDNVALQELARELAVEQKTTGRSILIYVWGWNTLEERISEDAVARKQFDPDYGAFSEKILEGVGQVALVQDDIKGRLDTGLAQVDARLARFEKRYLSAGDTTSGGEAVEAQLDAEIDEYRELGNAGKPWTALPLLERLLTRVASFASGRILFRIKANIGSCLLALGEKERAAQLLSDAFNHAPDEPKAIANKALSLLLQGRGCELLDWGREQLAADPTNEGLAGYLVQAARFDVTIEEPLDLISEGLKGSAAVAVGRIDVLRQRGRMPEWWQAARSAYAAHPDDRHARQFAAEADLDEIVRDQIFQRTQRLSPGQQEKIAAAAALLHAQWDDARSSEGVLAPEDAALCCNLIVAYHALDDLAAAIDVAREGLAVLPDDVELASRAALAAIDGGDDALAEQVLPRIPAGPDATVLNFRYHAAHGNWGEVARIWRTEGEYIPAVERGLMVTAGRLAELKLSRPSDLEAQLQTIALEVADDPRAEIVLAEFASAEGFEHVAEDAYKAALKCIDTNSHIASRLMVAMHASKRGDASVVVDLLDSHVAEDHDHDTLRVLARAFVNDSPIRQRAIRFFERLPAALKQNPFYLHAEGLLHFNRGALKQAESCLRRAIEGSPDLTNYLALFATLRRADRAAEIKPLLTKLDLSAVKGTPGQKMFLAQQLAASGMPKAALSFGYNVLQASKNDPEAGLRYFGLMMFDPNGRHTPRPRVIGLDVWVRLENQHNESHSFLIAKGPDRPAEGMVSVTHPLAAAAMGQKVGGTFTIKAAFGSDTTWRIVEIKHKYLHALHDVMANFQTRFPDAKGFYTVRMKGDDIQPALDEVRRVSESNRKLADLYLLQHLPMAMVASRLGRDSIGFAEYVRSLEQDIETCVGNVPERDAAREIVIQHRAAGAVLDTYAAWTTATMDIFDILEAVFGKLVIPRSSMDELRSLRERDDLGAGGRSMTMAWHNGQFVRQVLTREDIQVRDRFIAEQIAKIEKACEILPAAAPDTPSELAAMLTETFSTDVLDAADLAAAGYVLVSEDLYYRQMATAAVGLAAKSVWLQSVLAFARETQLISEERHAAAVVKLAWRRHSHVSIDAETLFQAWQADQSENLADFSALAKFIGTRNADMRSHLLVVVAFLNRIWQQPGIPELPVMRATGILLERLIRFRKNDWAVALAIVADDMHWRLQEYVERWTSGHFLDVTLLHRAREELNAVLARSYIARASRRPWRALHTTNWPLRG
jgi:tetratricopeptide (TPR) repeat protein